MRPFYLLLGVSLLALGCSPSPSPSSTGTVDAGDGDAAIVPPCIDQDCYCQSDADCGSHAECVTDIEEPACQCAAGYALLDDLCQFVGLADSHFEDPTSPWRDNGNTLFSPEASEVFFDLDEVAAQSSVSQTIALTTYEKAEPLVLSLRYQARDYKMTLDPPQYTWAFFPVGVAAFINGGLHYAPANNPLFGQESPAATHRFCLGEAAYGGDLEIRVGPGELNEQLVGSSWEVAVDEAALVVAAPGECPAPMEIRNASFDDPDGWVETHTGLGGSATVVQGSGSREAVLSGPTSCSLARLTGQASIPLATDSAPGYALEFTFSGVEGDVMKVGLGNKQFNQTYTGTQYAGAGNGLPGRTIGSVIGDGTRKKRALICLPEWSHGQSYPLHLSMQRMNGVCVNEPRQFSVDDLKIVADASCAPVAAHIDGSFERVLGPQRTDDLAEYQIGWDLNSPKAGGIEVVDTLAYSGAASLSLKVPQVAGCVSNLNVGTYVTVPTAGEGEYPAARIRMHFEPGKAATTSVRAWGELTDGYMNTLVPNGADGENTGEWITRELCFPVAAAGRISRFYIDYSAPACAAAESTRVHLDDLEMVSVPAADCDNVVGPF